jgi:hypothetical protein
MGLAEQRNRVVHDMWYLTDPKFPIRMKAMARKKLIFEPEHVPTEQLYNLAADILTLMDELDSLCDKAFNIWHQRPRKK